MKKFSALMLAGLWIMSGCDRGTTETTATTPAITSTEISETEQTTIAATKEAEIKQSAVKQKNYSIRNIAENEIYIDGFHFSMPFNVKELPSGYKLGGTPTNIVDELKYTECDSINYNDETLMTVHYFNKGLEKEYETTSVNLSVYYFNGDFEIYGLKKEEDISKAIEIFGEPDKIIDGYLPLYYYYDNDGSYIELKFKNEILHSVTINFAEE